MNISLLKRIIIEREAEEDLNTESKTKRNQVLPIN